MINKPRFNIGDYVILCDLSTVGKISSVRFNFNRFLYEYDCEYFDCDDRKRTLASIPEEQLRTCYDDSLRNNFEAKTDDSYCFVDYTHASKIKLQPLTVKKVIFNGNRTIVIFDNGTKSIVKCEGERFDKEKGLAMALVKAMYGTNDSHSNYYNIFKKWIPEEEVLPVDEVAYCERDAEVVKDLVENVAKNEVNNPCNGCENSKDGCFTNCEKLQKASDAISNNEESNKPKPIEPGYFIKHNAERKERSKYVATSKTVKEECEDFVNSHPNDIHAFVNRFSAAYFPADFLKFCRDNNLYFYIVDKIKGMKPIDPFTVTWQEVTGYLKRGLMTSCKKTKNNKAYLAVVMADNLFSMLPIELRKENRHE